MGIDTYIAIVGSIIIPLGGGIIASYMKIKKDTDKNTVKINDIETSVLQKVNELSSHVDTIFSKIDNKRDRIQVLERDLTEYLKKIEAEQKYVSKETINIHLDNLKESDENLKNEVNIFKSEMKSDLKEIKDLLKAHVDDETKLINELIVHMKGK